MHIFAAEKTEAQRSQVTCSRHTAGEAGTIPLSAKRSLFIYFFTELLSAHYVLVPGNTDLNELHGLSALLKPPCPVQFCPVELSRMMKLFNIVATSHM